MTLRSILVSALAVAHMAIGHPTARRNLAHRRAIDQGPESGSDIIIYDDAVTEPTRVAEVVVWVDDDGSALRTATEMVLLLPTSLALMETAASSSGEPTTTTTMTWVSTQTVHATPVISTPAANPTGDVATLPPSKGTGSPATSLEQSAVDVSSTASQAPVAEASNLPPVSSGPSSSNETDSSAASDSDMASPDARFGISYAPYRADHQCKSQQDIDDDFKRFAGSYSLVRIYGTDCDQVSKVYSAAKANGVKLFLGIWDLAAVQEESSKIIAAINGDWDMVHTVSVGNELVNSGQASPSQVVSAVRAARPILRAAGYTGPVVTVDTFIATEASPELCNESDYCAINAHAFFDSTIAAPQAGPWLLNTVSKVKSALAAPKRVIVTETGWPTDGMSNGKAVPGMSNQKAALDSIRKAFAANPGDIILFSAFNDLWKTRAAATFNADQYWGIGGAVSSCDN